MIKIRDVLLIVLLNYQVIAIDRISSGQKYEVVIPRRLHTQHKRDTQGKYPDLVQYGIQLEGKPLVLHLEKTEDLISENYTETRYLPDGTPITSSPEIQDHCYYQGHVKNDSDSVISISACKGLSGMILTRGRRFLIEPLNQTDSEEHAIYEFQEESPKTCGVTNTNYTEGKYTKTSLVSRDHEKWEFVRSKKFIELYVVADNSMFIKYERNTEKVKQRIFEIVNYVNVVYKAIKIFVALTGIEVWDRQNQFSVVTSSNENLLKFSNWRTSTLLPRKPHDNAQFITDTDFDGSTIGLAYVGTMCSETHSSGVIQDHTQESIAVGATVAHEMGHNLGMNHDENHCSCSDESCIMAGTLSHNTPKLFSTCSHQNLLDFLWNHMPLCMQNTPQKSSIQTPPVCGNTFTEQGEECDCGTVEECTNKCCDAATCKLKAEAQCAEGDCCDNCKIREAGHVCRASKDDCDLADMCNGNSPMCPSDRFRVNGFPCRNDREQGYCYNGKCPTLQSQCSVLWGAGSTAGSEFCFNYNSRGTEYGHCKQSSQDSYTACARKDVKCGVLQCSGGSSQPTISARYYRIADCKSVLTPEGVVEDGTKCGDDMICHSSKCTSIESAYKSTDCSAKCSGHAVCDHELKCQCEEGWTPPNCDISTRPRSTIIIAVVVIIVLIILVVAIGLLVKCYRGSLYSRQRRPPATASSAVNPTFRGGQNGRHPGFQAATPEPSRNHLYPPKPPAQSQKPSVPYGQTERSWPPSQNGYQAPRYPVAIQRPVTAPPPAPTNQPVRPTLPPQSINERELEMYTHEGDVKFGKLYRDRTSRQSFKTLYSSK
ncbi:zinc metalloproteinase-disintegrin-like VLAIP-B [Rhinophrynus dorsalis]